MKLRKSLVVSISALAFISPIALVTSCSKEFYSSSDIGGVETWLKNSVGSTTTVKEKADQIKQDYKNNPNNQDNKLAESLLNQKVIQITTGGKVNDNSFNQLVWESISSFSKSIGNNNSRYFETDAIVQGLQNDAYDYAISNGYKIWVLTGYQQESLLKSWLETGKNRERFNEAGVKIITVDWYSGELVESGKILGLNFKTQESSFTVGYAAAKLVSEVYPGSQNVNNRYFNTFAGGDFSGATNYNYGFYEGMRRWNAEQSSNDTKVASTIVSNSESVDLTTSFSITNDSKAKVNSAVDGYSTGVAPKVIMPVAGSLTSVAIDRVKEKKSDQWIVGVDTDMSFTYPSDKGFLLTSSEKRIAIAIYKALCLFFGLNSALGDEGINQVNMVWQNDEYLIKDKSSGQISSYNVAGGYAEGFVGVSKSTLNSKLKFNDGANAGKTYAQRFDEIVDETWDKFFGEDGMSGLFESTLVPTSEQLAKGPAYFNNPKYGQMTAGDLTTYFNKVILGTDNFDYLVVNSWLNKATTSSSSMQITVDQLLANTNLNVEQPKRKEDK